MKKEEYIFDADTLSHIADLARLDISGKEAELMLSQMREIINFASEICEYDPNCDIQDGRSADSAELLREDIPEKNLSREALIGASKYTDGEYFLVPDVLENRGAQ